MMRSPMVVLLIAAYSCAIALGAISIQINGSVASDSLVRASKSLKANHLVDTSDIESPTILNDFNPSNRNNHRFMTPAVFGQDEILGKYLKKTILRFEPIGKGDVSKIPGVPGAHKQLLWISVDAAPLLHASLDVGARISVCIVPAEKACRPPIDVFAVAPCANDNGPCSAAVALDVKSAAEVLSVKDGSVKGVTLHAFLMAPPPAN